MAVENLSGAGRVVRLVLVAAVLAAEFWFVVSVYHLDDDADRRASAWARVDALASSDPVPASLGDAAADLRASGAPGGAAVVSAVDQWVRDGDPASLTRLRADVRDAGQAVAAQQDRADARALWLIGALFVAVCVGWFWWFRRLASRHRALQRSLTEREVLDSEEKRLTALVRNSTDVVMAMMGDSTLTFLSPSATRVLGHEVDDLLDHPFIDVVHEEDRLVLGRALTDRLAGEREITFRVDHLDGSVVEVEGTLNDLHDDPAVRSWVLTIRDVTQRRRLERDLVHQAFHDSLTGLANRQLFGDRLEHALHRSAGGSSPTSVLFIDVDDFKFINDSLGHDVGDRALLQVARRIGATLRRHDTLARLGGDEFAVLLEATGSAEAEAVGQEVLRSLQAPIRLDGADQAITVSIGVASTATPAAGTTAADGGAPTVADLLRHADMAMYAAKEAGKSAVVVYDAQQHDRALHELALRLQLREAVTQDQLVLHFQPTVDIATEAVAGFEALVRWEHPTRGLLQPADFLPAAERSGLITLIGAWVLDEACRAAVQLTADAPHVTMSVNVSPQQLVEPGFAASVLTALRTSGLRAESLVLEITETALHTDIEAVALTLADLREHGVAVAIDDFGTGYSSLSALASLPVDVLKVDKSFIDRIDDHLGDGRALVEAIFSMSQALTLRIVAEGVEEASQATWLRAHGEMLGQGYYWSRPVPLAEAQRLARHGVDPPAEGDLADVVPLRTAAG